MSDNKSPERTVLTRRDMIKKVVLPAYGIGIAAAGAIAVLAQQKQQAAPEQIAPVNAEAVDMEAQLKATATALDKNKELTSFREEPGFSKELFKKAQQGVFAIEIIGNNAPRGTAWLAKQEGNSYYFVTNEHANGLLEQPYKSMNLWRPNIDTSRFVPDKINMAWLETSTGKAADLLVIRCEGNFNPQVPVSPIKWQDDADLKQNERVLIVGFPEAFKKGYSQSDFFTMGQVVSIDEPARPESGSWKAKGLVGGGGSGSPAIVSHNNEPLAVATIFAISESEQKILGVPLQVQKLINALKD